MAARAPARIVPSRTFAARLTRLLRTADPDSFETTDVSRLDLGFDGIAGDRHCGLTRRTGGREPWHRRGTEIRNERQLSIVCPDELAAVAAEMGVEALDAGWIGANMVLEGVADLTRLPPRTLLFFSGGATVRIDGLNIPCRFAGAAVARRHSDRAGLDMAFVRAARRRRGLVGWVEKPGVVEVGAAVSIRTPEHWLYDGGSSAG